jgi:hypothetical protein
MKYQVIASKTGKEVILKEGCEKKDAEEFAKCIEGCEKLAGYEVIIREE